MRIRSIKPEFWRSDDIDPDDKQSWKRFGQSGAGREFLYRLYDVDNRLLYVGITWNPFVRWTAHSRKHSWWADVAYAQVWICSDEDARYWETRCIKEQLPLHNIHQSIREVF